MKITMQAMSQDVTELITEWVAQMLCAEGAPRGKKCCALTGLIGSDWGRALDGGCYEGGANTTDHLLCYRHCRFSADTEAKET